LCPKIEVSGILVLVIDFFYKQEGGGVEKSEQNDVGFGRGGRRFMMIEVGQLAGTVPLGI